jgi:polyribonucleotide nucleotidyltransferase
LKATSLLIASGALAISGIPFNGPIGAARVSIDGQYVLNPGKTQLKDSKMDLVVAGTEARCADGRSKLQPVVREIMLGAIVYGHAAGQHRHQPSTNWCVTRANRLGLASASQDEALIAKVGELAGVKLQAAYQLRPAAYRRRVVTSEVMAL